jgi:large subunit ribosomal protein L35
MEPRGKAAGLKSGRPALQDVLKETRGSNGMPRNSTNPKKKLKTHRGARKRFKITGTGKIKRMHSGKRHLLGTKKPGRMRKLKKLTLVSKADVRTLRQMMPYG